ncbi:protein RTE1-HOMOLOG-like isoform X2 [Wolffia australiana]
MQTGEIKEESFSMEQKTIVEAVIDPRRARFPRCIVWTPLPIISWFIPFIGHLGICREDGVILDFAGPYFVSVDNFAFGAVARYLPLDRSKIPTLAVPWDESLRKSTVEFQHKPYNLLTCNCHSFVASCLNNLADNGRGEWNVVKLAAWVFFKGKCSRSSQSAIDVTSTNLCNGTG